MTSHAPIKSTPALRAQRVIRNLDHGLGVEWAFSEPVSSGEKGAEGWTIFWAITAASRRAKIQLLAVGPSRVGKDQTHQGRCIGDLSPSFQRAGPLRRLFQIGG
jgi:hypothetical protein